MKKTAKSTDTQREKERKKNLDSTDGRAYAYTLYDKVKKWVCCEWPIVRPSFSLKKKKTKNNKQNNLVQQQQQQKNHPPQIQKYILPKRFTKIKWNSTCSGRQKTEWTAQASRWRAMHIARIEHCTVHTPWMQFGFCSWLTPSATVSNSNLSFIRKSGAVQQKGEREALLLIE